MNRHIMNSAQGAAVRIQLDAMIAALQGFDGPAVAADDRPVSRLLCRLYDAAQEAKTIENRSAALPLYRGVSLVKR